MAVNLSELEPSLRIELPGIPEPVLSDAINRVVRQFFWRSEAWKYVADNGKDWTVSVSVVPTLTAGTDIPTNTMVKRIDTIKYSADGSAWDDEIPFKTRDELDRENPDWESETGTSPVAWTINNDGDAFIIPQPTATVSTGLLLRAVIVPTTSLTALPNFLFYEFEEVFKAGVLGQLMKQPGKDWSNPQGATVYLNAFKVGIDQAKSRAEASFGQPKDVMAYGGI